MRKQGRKALKSRVLLLRIRNSWFYRCNLVIRLAYKHEDGGHDKDGSGEYPENFQIRERYSAIYAKNNCRVPCCERYGRAKPEGNSAHLKEECVKRNQ